MNTGQGVTQSLVAYQYDLSNRLISATIDLSPDNTGDSQTYVTSYTYDGTSNAKRLKALPGFTN